MTYIHKQGANPVDTFIEAWYIRPGTPIAGAVTILDETGEALAHINATGTATFFDAKFEADYRAQYEAGKRRSEA